MRYTVQYTVYCPDCMHYLAVLAHMSVDSVTI